MIRLRPGFDGRVVEGWESRLNAESFAADAHSGHWIGERERAF